MVIDTSALFAIEMLEAEAQRFDELIRSAPRRLLSVVNAHELTTVLTSRRARDERATLTDLVGSLGIELVPVNVQQMHLAAEAMVRFGKGRHPARLNMGDCFAYALARDTGEPLLFKGADFTLTDVTPAV